MEFLKPVLERRDALEICNAFQRLSKIMKKDRINSHPERLVGKSDFSSGLSKNGYVSGYDLTLVKISASELLESLFILNDELCGFSGEEYLIYFYICFVSDLVKGVWCEYNCSNIKRISLVTSSISSFFVKTQISFIPTLLKYLNLTTLSWKKVSTLSTDASDWDDLFSEICVHAQNT